MKHLLSIADLSAKEIEGIITLAQTIKEAKEI